MSFLEQLMQTVNGATFISLCTETPVKLKGGKSNPLQGRVSKVVLGSNVMVFTNQETNGYKSMVERRLVQEGKNPNDFQLAPRAWGVRDQGTPFVRHNGKLYLEVIFLSAGAVEYHVDGKKVDPTTIEGLDLEPKTEAEQGGLSNKVIVRTYDVSNIKTITINKHQYVL